MYISREQIIVIFAVKFYLKGLLCSLLVNYIVAIVTWVRISDLYMCHLVRISDLYMCHMGKKK